MSDKCSNCYTVILFVPNRRSRVIERIRTIYYKIRVKLRVGMTKND